MQFLPAGAGDDRDLAHPELLLPPAGVLGVPGGGPAQALLEGHARRPAKQPSRLRTVGRMPEHLAGTLARVSNETLGRAHHAHDQVREVGDADALAAANVDHLASKWGDVGV